MIPGSVNITLAAANAANIVALIKPTGAGNLSLVTSPWVADAPRRIQVTYGNEANNRTILISGTNRYAAPISETLTIPLGASGTIYTQQDFLTVTSVTVYGAWTQPLSVGTCGTGSTEWYIVQRWLTPPCIGVGVIVTGTVTYTVEHTYDDPLAAMPAGVVAPYPFPHPTLAALSATNDGAYSTPIVAFRLTINSGTGSARFVRLQAGNRQ